MLRTPGWTTTWTVVRAVAAVLIAAAIIAQGMTTIGGAITGGRDVATTTANFFSFFTVLSNVASVIVLAWAVVWFLLNREASRESRPLATALACVTTYMIVTGIVYNVLLRSIALPQGTTVAWSNEVLHLIGPLLFLADVFLAPRRRALSWRTIGIIVAFPIVWIVYTLLRGVATTNPVSGETWWYPYPFLNPNNAGGYATVSIYIVIIAIAIAVVATFVVWMSRRRGAMPEATPIASRAVSAR